MSRYAERFTVLQEATNLLLDRVYFLLREMPKCPKYTLEKVAKFVVLLTKVFPESPANVEKISGYDVVKQYSQEIHDELYRPYATFLDLLEYKEHALSLLLEVSTNAVSLQFQDNAEYMIAFMNLLVGYIQLHLLFGRLENRKGIIAMFDQVVRIKTGAAERNYQRLATFIHETDNVVKKLQEDLSPLDSRVRETLLNLNTTFEKCNSVPALRKEGALSLLASMDRLTLPIQDHYRFELVYLGQFQLWIIYGFLACPRAITEETQNILKAVLSDGWVIPIYRDEVMFTHAEFEFIAEKTPNLPVKNSKLKKLINEAAVTAIQNSGPEHINRRIYLRQEIKGLVQLMQDRPGLLGPKIQILFAALSLSKYEVMWYFRHTLFPPPKGKGKYSAEQYSDYLIAEIIWLMEQMTSLIQKYRTIIQTYYAEYTCGPDCAKVKEEFEIATKSGVLDVILSRMMNAIIGDLSKSLLGDIKEGKPVSYKALRMNWLRCISFLSSTQSAVRINKVKELVLKTQMAINHSRCVDSLDVYLKEYASLGELFYYQGEYEKSYVGFLECYPAFAFSMVRQVQNFSLNISASLPDQQTIAGTACVTFARNLIIHACKYLRKCISYIYEHFHRLAFQTSTTALLAQSQAALQGKAWAEPGSESQGIVRTASDIDGLRRWENNLIGLAKSFGQFETFVVYDRSLRPTQILHDYLIRYVVNWLRETCFASNGAMEKPSDLLFRIPQMNSVIQMVCKHACIDSESVMKTALAHEFIHPNSAVPTVLLDGIESKSTKVDEYLICRIAKWYTMLLSLNTAITYSPARRSMIGSTESGISFDTYSSFYELKSLCMMIGPSGARYIDTVVLQTIPEKLGVLKGILEKNRDLLKEYSRNYPRDCGSTEFLRKIKELDTFMLYSSQIGTTLFFRTLLRDALNSCTQESIPFIVRVSKDLSVQFSKAGFVEKDSALADCLAYDAALKPERIDVAVRAMFVTFQKQTGGDSIWELLPSMFSLVLHSSLWQNAQYVESLEVHTRNMHSIGIALYHLIVGFSTNKLVEDPEARVKSSEGLAEFVKLSTG
eukprot:TRINITY_DN5416_c0_g1_i7.p1 TRINITY_DN5416_c0_g1~~TRINITY_DN5416_c0_g1_i7.p1  ORF type:complete len:1061 (+),score=180.95 TRINITY_DN5416_c0_g1_i7:43-3225(+)